MAEKVIADTLLEIADAIESGNYSKKLKIGLTTMGSELGSDTLYEGAKLAKDSNYEIVLIGKAYLGFECYETADEDAMYQKMEELLDQHIIDACVTMHYNFPIGVSTVGRLVTPAFGKETFIATTTGTSSTKRVEAMVKNTIYGIACAKACGIENPSVGIMNLEGSRSVEKILANLQKNGYNINFAESKRADGGVVMRGNDLLLGACDVMVCDSLTGNMLMKVFSAFNSGGKYEVSGYGYGPGIGENYDRRVLIISRASGAPVVANAIRYAYQVSKGKINEITNQEFALANKYGLKDQLNSLQTSSSESTKNEEVKMPDKEVVTHGIAGIDILALDDAVEVLWKAGIYAESGMGCTGPVILVSENNQDKAEEELRKHEFIN